MTHVLYPIHIDHWTDPIATLLREIALHNPELTFFSFSQPRTEEDRVAGRVFWEKPHIHRATTLNLLQRRFDIVHHASATEKNLGAALLCRVRNPGRCIHLFTANSPPDRQSTYYLHYRLSVRLAHQVIAVSQAVADAVQEHFGRKADGIIPNGANLSFFASEAAQSLNGDLAGIQQPYVLFVGVIRQSKRPDIFIQLAALLPQITFVMVGGAFQHQERDHFLHMAGRCPNIIYLGPQPRAKVRDLMANALALIFPSEREGLPLTVVEAAAMGLPVLAQPKSALPEVVHAGLTGWLLPIDQLDAWVQKIQEIASWSAVERHTFAGHARAFVAERYAWDVIARQYQMLYVQPKGS